MNEFKFCTYCGEQINKNANVCPKCGRLLNTNVSNNQINYNNSDNNNNNTDEFYTQTWFMYLLLVIFAPVGILFMWKFHPEMKKKTKIILTAVFGVLFILFAIISINNNNSNSNLDNNYNNNNNNYINNDNSNSNKNNNSSNNNNNNKKTIGFNDTFEFDDLEMSISSDYIFDTVSNKYSSYYGSEYIKLPITVKNINDETHGLNMFFYKVYGSKGSKVENLNIYYTDDSVDYAGDLRSGASYTKYIYFLYDGDGTYSIEFDSWTEKKVVEFNITK